MFCSFQNGHSPPRFSDMAADWLTLSLKVMYDSAMSFQFIYTLALDGRPMHAKTCKDLLYGKKGEYEAKHKVWPWHISPERWRENYLQIRVWIELSAVLINRHSMANKDWILSNDVRHLQEDRFTDCRKGKYIHTRATSPFREDCLFFCI